MQWDEIPVDDVEKLLRLCVQIHTQISPRTIRLVVIFSFIIIIYSLVSFAGGGVHRTDLPIFNFEVKSITMSTIP